jgi:F-type H+-transporting ATPase subunit delta
VATTTELTDELRKQFTDIVASATGKTVQLAEKIDPSLVGGYVLTIGDRQIDASLRSRLNELKLQFVN